MVSAFVPRARGLGSSPGRGHCVVFLGKTHKSHSASLHPQHDLSDRLMILVIEFRVFIKKYSINYFCFQCLSLELYQRISTASLL